MLNVYIHATYLGHKFVSAAMMTEYLNICYVANTEELSVIKESFPNIQIPMNFSNHWENEEKDQYVGLLYGENLCYTYLISWMIHLMNRVKEPFRFISTSSDITASYLLDALATCTNKFNQKLANDVLTSEEQEILRSIIILESLGQGWSSIENIIFENFEEKSRCYISGVLQKMLTVPLSPFSTWTKWNDINVITDIEIAGRMVYLSSNKKSCFMEKVSEFVLYVKRLILQELTLSHDRNKFNE